MAIKIETMILIIIINLFFVDIGIYVIYRFLEKLEEDIAELKMAVTLNLKMATIEVIRDKTQEGEEPKAEKTMREMLYE